MTELCTLNRKPSLFSKWVFLAICLLPTWSLAEAAPPSAPNVVLFFIDDMGWRDWSGGGSDYLSTPSIDRIAREGLVFSNGYVNAANCAPSRCALLSGQYTPRTHFYNVWSIHRGDKKQDRLSLDDVRDGQVFEEEKVCFAEAMKKAGYRTAMYGKWHVSGHTKHGSGDGGVTPAMQGFGDVWEHGADELKKLFKESDGSDPKHVYGYTRRAMQFAETCVAEKKPFLIYLAHHAVHGPNQFTSEAMALYQGKKPGTINRTPAYGAMMHDTDRSIGMMLDKLEHLGVSENTIVFLLSDNGGVPSRCTQPPLRAYKGSYYEGGIRVPFLVRWPKVIKPGNSDVPVMAIDLYPTMLEAAGVTDIPEHVDGYPLDGSSLLPLFQGLSVPERALFWHFPGYLIGNPKYTGTRTPNYRAKPVSVIRKGDWKLHLFLEEWSLDGGREALATNNAVELYDLSSDPGETRNLSHTAPEKREELLQELLDWHTEIEAEIPKKPNAQRQQKKEDRNRSSVAD